MIGWKEKVTLFGQVGFSSNLHLNGEEKCIQSMAEASVQDRSPVIF
jgi:hypothetical protein